MDEQIVEHIRRYGVYRDSGEARLKALAGDIGVRLDQRARYVVIGGCLIPELIPGAVGAFKQVLELLRIDYTFLSKEYCCGWIPLGQPAVMAKNEEGIARSKELSRGLIRENLRQAEDLGAEAVVLFCAACEPNYSNCEDLTELEILPYAQLLDRHFGGATLEREVDYYAGCYRFRRRIAERPLDVEAGLRVLRRIRGLKLNELDNRLCCYVPSHLERLTGSLKTEQLVTACTGCYGNLGRTLQSGSRRVSMLPELVLEALQR